MLLISVDLQEVVDEPLGWHLNVIQFWPGTVVPVHHNLELHLLHWWIGFPLLMLIYDLRGLVYLM